MLTLDAGGTNFVFSAIRGCMEVVKPVRVDAVHKCVNACLKSIVDGFHSVMEALDERPVAISFAFPGPADYRHGVIGDLPNFPAFRGGVALGPYLRNKFGIPVFINNDGALFAYGEAMEGELPRINAMLRQKGSHKHYDNLIGITLGTGFGGGVVTDGRLLYGDNGCGGYVWNMRNFRCGEMIAEESVSARGITRIYREHASGDDRPLTPEDIFNIAEGMADGDKNAALVCFREFGEAAGEAIAHAMDIVDGIVVIGGGISHAYKYFMPSLVGHLRSSLKTYSGEEFPIVSPAVYDLTVESGLEEFLHDGTVRLPVPDTDETVEYEVGKKTGVTVSSSGANRSIFLGAYAFALNQLDK